MLDLTIIFFLKNIIIVAILFWLLTFGGSFFYDRFEYKTREDFYECGFKTTSDINFNLNFSFFLSAVFLILYDIELVFLIPFLFNYTQFSLYILCSYFFFVICIFITFIWDIWTESIEWYF